MFEKADEPPEANALIPSHVPATSGTTLLPRPVASLVSLLTQSTSLTLRIGSFFGGVALDGARATTLTSLELGRAVVEGILTRAGRDVAFRSGDEHGRMETESLLERSVRSHFKTRDLLLTFKIVGNITYNRDLGIFLRRSYFSFLVNNALVRGELLTGITVDPRCDFRINRVF